MRRAGPLVELLVRAARRRRAERRPVPGARPAPGAEPERPERLAPEAACSSVLAGLERLEPLEEAAVFSVELAAQERPGCLAPEAARSAVLAGGEQAGCLAPEAASPAEPAGPAPAARPAAAVSHRRPAGHAPVLATFSVARPLAARRRIRTSVRRRASAIRRRSMPLRRAVARAALDVWHRRQRLVRQLPRELRATVRGRSIAAAACAALRSTPTIARRGTIATRAPTRPCPRARATRVLPARRLARHPPNVTASEVSDGICGGQPLALIDGIPAYAMCDAALSSNVWSSTGANTAGVSEGPDWVETGVGLITGTNGYQCTELTQRYFYFRFGICPWSWVDAKDMCTEALPPAVVVASTPVHGDLMVVPPGCDGAGQDTGHVAVVDSVSGSMVSVVQQNSGTNGYGAIHLACATCFLHAVANTAGQ